MKRPHESARDAELPANFDPEFYLIANPDVAAAGQDAKEHYLLYGSREGRIYSREGTREIHFSSKHSARIHDPVLPDIDGDAVFSEIFARAGVYSMTPKERMYALYEAIRYVVRANVPGDFVECGVWKGGSSIAAGLAFDRFLGSNHERRLFLYDTFEGMAPPTDVDVDASGATAASYIEQCGDEGRWAYASEAEVRANFELAGPIHAERIFVAGDVRQTIPKIAPDTIAVCRLDTDWFQSTAHELEHLYPRIAPGGVLILDDYGDWAGARRAVDEYFAHRPECMLVRIDTSARLVIKPR